MHNSTFRWFGRADRHNWHTREQSARGLCSPSALNRPPSTCSLALPRPLTLANGIGARRRQRGKRAWTPADRWGSTQLGQLREDAPTVRQPLTGRCVGARCHGLSPGRPHRGLNPHGADHPSIWPPQMQTSRPPLRHGRSLRRPVHRTCPDPYSVFVVVVVIGAPIRRDPSPPLVVSRLSSDPRLLDYESITITTTTTAPLSPR